MEEVKRFKELKKAKVLDFKRKVLKDQNGQHEVLEMEAKRFDPNTGEQLEPQVQQIQKGVIENSLEALLKKRLELDAQIENLEFLLSQFKK